MRIIIVRHGQTQSNVVRAVDTEIPGAPLNEIGIKQAENLVTRLAQVQLDALACSPIQRAQQTLAPLAKARGIMPLILEGLREVRAGKYEMSVKPEDLAAYFATVYGWFTGNDQVVMHPEENFYTVVQRFDQAVNTLCVAGQQPILVSHGTVLATWALARVKGMTMELALNHHLDNTEYYTVEGTPGQGSEPGKWEIVHWGNQ